MKCPKVSSETKQDLKRKRAQLDPIELAQDIETKLHHIYKIIEETEAQREEEDKWLAEEPSSPSAVAGSDCVAAPVAIAPSASTPSEEI